MPALIKLIEDSLFGSSSSKELFHKSRLTKNEEGYMPWYGSAYPFVHHDEKELTWMGSESNTGSAPPMITPGFFPPPLGGAPVAEKTYEPGTKGKLWNWEFDLNRPNQVNNLSCISESMHNMEMTVCDYIKWEDPEVTVGSGTYRLPLSKAYLAEAFHTNHGKTNTSSKYWKVPTEFDKAMLLVFAYQFNGSSKTWEPVPDHVLKAKDFMPVAIKGVLPPEAEIPAVSVSVNSAAKLVYQAHRIVVCVEMICCQPSYDYEPLGILKGARFFPNVMLISNRKIDRIKTDIQIVRPDNNGMEMEDMDSAIKSGFYTDRNDGYPFRAIWNDLFAYHHQHPQVGDSFVVVDPAKKRKRIVRFAVMKAKVPALRTLTLLYDLFHQYAETKMTPEMIEQVMADQLKAWKNPDLRDLPTYVEQKFSKVPRQGEFDNVHIAPRMKFPAHLKKRLPDWQAEDISMAPACVHDCFHMHWRWLNQLVTNEIPEPLLWLARQFTDENTPYLKGWKDDYEPHSLAGAPMIPANQKLTIRMLRQAGFNYGVEIEKPVKPGNWQIVLHHGGSYGINVHPVKKAVMVNHETVQLQPLKYLKGISQEELEGWSLIYTCFRYGYLPGYYKKPFERIMVTALDIARKA